MGNRAEKVAVDTPPAAMTGAASADAELRARFARDVVCIGGLPFDVVDLKGAVVRLRDAARSRTRCFVSTPNLNFVIAARRDAAFRHSVLRSDLSLADGAPVVWLARGLGLPLRERVAGADVFEALRAHPGEPLKVFFFGGPPGAAEAACSRLAASTHGLRAVGWDDAGFGDVEAMSGDERIARINASGADFVVAALGAAKGQAWLERNAARLEAPLLCHLGAVVNFAAGRVSRAPRLVRRLGLEWVWRIKEEPHLWQRYRRDGMAFTRLLVRLVPAWIARLRARESTESRCRFGRAGAVVRLELDGTWTAAELAPLRRALAEAALQGVALEIDLTGVDRIDAAFLGLLALAHGTFGPAGLRVVGAGDRVRRAFRHHGAEYLLGAAA